LEITKVKHEDVHYERTSYKHTSTVYWEKVATSDIIPTRIPQAIQDELEAIYLSSVEAGTL